MIVCFGAIRGAAAVTLANTQADFSIAAEGTNGIEYGVYTTANVTTGTFSTANFTVVNGNTWYGGESLGTPAFRFDIQHPAFDTLHPAVRRYTVGSSGEPAYTGLVHIFGNFFDADGGATSGFVTVNGVNLFNQDVPNTGNATGTAPFDLTVAVAPGSTIDFGVNAGVNAFSDSTGLSAVIESVPEPLALPITLLAAVTLRLGRRRGAT
jgi:hypothetical protein